MAAQGRHVFGQPAGQHQGHRAAQLFFDALGHPVQQHRRAHHRAREHTLRRGGADGVPGAGQVDLGQLGAAVPQGPQPGGQPRADHPAPEHPVPVHHVEGGGGAQVHGDHRQRIVGRGVGRIRDAVLAHGLGVGHPHGQPGADGGPHDHRVPAGVVPGAGSQRAGQLGHHAGQHSPLEPHLAFRVAPPRKDALHLGAVLGRGAGAHRVHVGHKAYTSVLDAPQGDGGVAYIDG